MRSYLITLTYLLSLFIASEGREEVNGNQDPILDDIFEDNNPFVDAAEKKNKTLKESSEEEAFWERFLQDLPSMSMTMSPSTSPSQLPSTSPTESPTARPSSLPSRLPSVEPSSPPSTFPSAEPSAEPSVSPSKSPSAEPSTSPSSFPTTFPSSSPSEEPTVLPTLTPSAEPSTSPSKEPSTVPSASPSVQPTSSPSVRPSSVPSYEPSATPSLSPSVVPSVQPTSAPSARPSSEPSLSPTSLPSSSPSASPSVVPSVQPTSVPSAQPSSKPSSSPTSMPSTEPSETPTSVPSNEPCVVDVMIECETADGRKCNTLEYPRGECSATQGDLETLQFQFIPGTCDDSRNDQGALATCNDLDPIDSQINSMIRCRDAATEDDMIVTPSLVPANSIITVTAPNGRPLPDQLECSIVTSSGTTLQSVTIDTSGNASLKLFDQFGSLRLESCDNLICVVDATYEYIISNMGNVEMEISLVDRSFNGETISLLDRVQMNPLPEGMFERIREEVQYNLCEKEVYNVEINVEANPPDGVECEADDTYSFNIIPDCIVDLDMTCTVTGSDLACTDLQGEDRRQCVCSQCSSNMVFRYTGETCSSGTNNDGLLSCADSNGGPTPVAQISVRDAQEILFEGMATVGMHIDLSSSGNCIGDVIFVTVRAPGSNTVTQEIEISATCELGTEIILLDSFGSLDFVGYTCSDEDKARNCFVGVTYDIIAENEGKVPFSINQFSMVLNGVPIDFMPRLSSEELVLDESEELRVNQTALVERCVDFRSSARASVSGLADSSTIVCEASEAINFELLQGTKFPTISPSETPSQEPSAPPSSVPSVQPSAQPTSQPSIEPTSIPSSQPSAKPSAKPSSVPTSVPTTQPSGEPTSVPSLDPSSAPSAKPTSQPSGQPSGQPTEEPTSAPSLEPSSEPSSEPSAQPSGVPTSVPSSEPTSQPSGKPTSEPSATPSSMPSSKPSGEPSSEPSVEPTCQPSDEPTSVPSLEPTSQPSNQPTSMPSSEPSPEPSSQPSREPSAKPSPVPTSKPSSQPTSMPSIEPTSQPSNQPTSVPTALPSLEPSSEPSSEPSTQPSAIPTSQPSNKPTSVPSLEPSASPTSEPSSVPSESPTSQPSSQPTSVPSSEPTSKPSNKPTSVPSAVPSSDPSSQPSSEPSSQPSDMPTGRPSNQPTSVPSLEPSASPSSEPSSVPSEAPTFQPSGQPTSVPSSKPSSLPSDKPTSIPSALPSSEPSSQPSSEPSLQPSDMPTNQPSDQPTLVPSLQPSASPSSEPSSVPSEVPSSQPSSQPTSAPSSEPSSEPSNTPTTAPTAVPSLEPSAEPSSEPSSQPSDVPTSEPSGQPTLVPSLEPSTSPSSEPSSVPSEVPTSQPSSRPTSVPSAEPTSQPSIEPSSEPSVVPSSQPSGQPTSIPSLQPTSQPSDQPTSVPSLTPSEQPSATPSANPTFQPSIQPSSLPSDQPTSVPSAEPSPPPTSAPSTFPTEQPTSVPSAEPSDQPTSVPSSFPTLGPSATPSSEPSIEPTLTPSREPSVPPSDRPTSVPSEMPSPAPSVFPSDMPTSPCILDLNVQCILAEGENEGEACEGQIANTLCLQRPTSATMLYNGGDCSQSDNIQELLFSCEDFNGGPPEAEGERSWIVVTDIKGLGITYFEGYVGVGQNYALNDNNLRFQADQSISIYRNENVTDPENLLQLVQYHSSCSSNLELNNRFGASQLTSFFNQAQGNVSVFNAANFTLDIVIPIDIAGDSAVLTSLVSLTNFAGLIDLSDQVANKTVVPGEELKIIVPATLDLGVAMRYTFLSTLEGVGQFGQQCMGTSFTEFVAGRPENIPTALPTISPTVSPQPTPDPLLTQCDLSAEITCVSSIGGCSGLQSPSSPRCTSQGVVSELSFIYNGLPCTASNSTGRDYSCITSNGGPILNPPTPVWILVRDNQLNTIYFNSQVGFGDVFTFTPPEGLVFENQLTIEVARITSGVRGVALQTVELRTSCDDRDDISLLTQYGSLQLTSYRSDENGFQSAFQLLDLTFTVKNDGRLDAIVTTGSINSTLFGLRDVITPPGRQFPPDVSQSFSFNAPLNLYEAAGQTFFNTFAVNGTAVRNDIACPETAQLDITVGL